MACALRLVRVYIITRSAFSTLSADADAEVLEEEEEEENPLCACCEKGMLAHGPQVSPHGAFLSVCAAACVGFSVLSR